MVVQQVVSRRDLLHGDDKRLSRTGIHSLCYCEWSNWLDAVPKRHRPPTTVNILPPDKHNSPRRLDQSMLLYTLRFFLLL